MIRVRPLRFAWCLGLFVVAWQLYDLGAALLVFVATIDEAR